MPPPTGVVSGPLIPMRYSRKVSTVSCGSQSPVLLKAFSPARTSFHAIDLPCFLAAASITSCAAGQMSTPVPSPSMNGMIGSSDTSRVPSLRNRDLVGHGLGDYRRRYLPVGLARPRDTRCRPPGRSPLRYLPVALARPRDTRCRPPGRSPLRYLPVALARPRDTRCRPPGRSPLGRAMGASDLRAN